VSGGEFLSGTQKWFRIKFKCSAAALQQSILASLEGMLSSIYSIMQGKHQKKLKNNEIITCIILAKVII
jgi:hypothetical protein